MKIRFMTILGSSLVLFLGGCAPTTPPRPYLGTQASSASGASPVKSRRTPSLSAEELRGGRQAFEQYKAKHPRSRDAAFDTVVQRVGRRLARVANLSSADWEFVTFASTTPNAFAMPGGRVGVHQGLKPIAGNEAGLASVLAHEIAHVSLLHHRERKSRTDLAKVGSVLVDAVFQSAGGTPQARQVAQGLYGQTVQHSFLLPFSRNQELEADLIGVRMMKVAGYPPQAAVDTLKRLQLYYQRKGVKNTGTGTHPELSERIARLQAALR